MNNFYGVWAPSSGALPNTKDLDFAAYYITDTGTVANTLYEKDNWLIYICESRGTLSERSYWRVTDGVVLVNPDSHTNVPDAGFYTKVRLDNAGNIVAATDIEYDDLPQELKDKLKSVSDENINKLISAQLSELFKNNSLNPLQFKYDSKTGKIGAELKVDEETISINEFGQLCVIGDVGSSTSISIDTKEIEKRLSDIENTLVQIKPIEGDGIRISYKKGGAVISVDIDEDSLTYNADGRLCVNPDILSEYINEGSGGQCANHEHTADQIKDLEDVVNDIINNSSITNTVKSSLSDLIDEQTIIINSEGRLEAIATHVQKHQHKMDDITDLNKDIANVWATNQKLHAANNNQDFNKGAIMMSTLTVGEVLIAFNELLKEQAESIKIVGDHLGTIEPTEPGLIDTATFIDISNKKEMFDVISEKSVLVSEGETVVKTDDVIFYDGSVIKAFIDNEEVERMNAYDEVDRTFGKGSYGNFNVTYFGDAYPKFKTFQGYYKGFSFTYKVPSIDEGVHTIYFTQENINTGVITKSDIITFNTYVKKEPTCDIIIEKQPEYNSYVSGVKTCNGQGEISIRVETKNFTKRFAPIYKNHINVLDKDYYLEYLKTENNIIYRSLNISDDFAGIVNIKAFISDSDGKYSSFETQTNYINIDTSDEEQYRYVQDAGNMIPIDNGTDVFTKYDSSFQLLGKYDNELQVKNHIAYLGKTNYESIGIGPDYTSKPSQQMITLRFECPKMNNFYFDLVDENGLSYDRNKDGTLKDIQIYAGIAPSNVVTKWVNCNKPYEGYGAWNSGIIFKALDLFRCWDERIYVTFGKDGTSESGYLYLKLITNGKPFNLQKLVASVKESIDERR